MVLQSASERLAFGGFLLNKKIYKSFPAFVTKAEQNGIVEAYVSVFGNLDHGNDIFHRGAFAKTLAERGSKVRVLDNHATNSTLNVVGKPLEIREVARDQLPEQLLARYPDATGGLFTRTQYLMNTPEGAGVFARIEAGAIDEYSVGVNVIKYDMEKRETDAGSRLVRNIREVKMYEYSPVIFAQNDATTTISAKSDDMLREAMGSSACQSCVAYRGVTDEKGYCTTHDMATQIAMICDQYAAPEPEMTLADDVRERVHEALLGAFDDYVQRGLFSDEAMERLEALMTPLLGSLIDMLPDDLFEQTLPPDDKPLTTPKSQDDSQIEGKAAAIEAEPQNALTSRYADEAYRQARLKALRLRQQQITALSEN